MTLVIDNRWTQEKALPEALFARLKSPRRGENGFPEMWMIRTARLRIDKGDTFQRLLNPALKALPSYVDSRTSLSEKERRPVKHQHLHCGGSLEQAIAVASAAWSIR